MNNLDENKKRKLLSSALDAINEQTGYNIPNPMLLTIYEHLVYVYRAGWDVGYEEGRCVRSNQKPVLQFYVDGTYLDSFKSAAEASRKLDIDHSGIVNVANGKQHTCGGFVWKWKIKK